MDTSSPALELETLLGRVVSSSIDGIHANEAVRNERGEIIDFRCTVANPAAMQIVNAPPDWVGRTLLDCFPQARASGLFERTKRVVETGHSDIFEYRLVASVQERWIRIAMCKQLDGVTAIISDVTTHVVTGRELQLSQQQLEMHLLRTPLAAIEWDLDFKIKRWNPAAQSIFGWSAEEALGQHGSFLIPDSLHAKIDEVWQELLKLSGGLRNTNENVTKSGKIIKCEWYNTPLIDRHGRVTGVASLSQDVTERQQVALELTRTNRALKMLSSCNATLVRAEKETELLEEICRIAVQIGGYRMAWVGYAQENAERTIQPMASAGEEHGYLTECKFSWAEDNAMGMGKAGHCIRSGQPGLSLDVAKDSSFDPWRIAAEKRGYRSIICLPLRGDKRVFGVIALYSGNVQEIADDEVVLLQEMADNLAFGIMYLRSREEQRRIQAGVLKVAASVSAGSSADFFIQLAHGMVDALGASSSFIARVLPTKPLMARTIAAVVDGITTDNFDYAVAGTPSENLIKSNEHVIASNVAARFPNSPAAQMGAQAYAGHQLNNSRGDLVGMIFVIFRGNLPQTEFITSTLRIFAARAAAELERQQTDSQLREQASLLDKAQDAILVRDLRGIIRYWNQSAERLYGWSAAETVGRSVSDFLYQDKGLFYKLTKQVIEFGDWTGELDQIRRDGLPMKVEARLTLLRGENGQPESVLSISTDITERKKLEAQILRAQRMESIGTLAGGIAHDLNNVLTPILMSVNMLREKVDDEKGRALLDTLATSSERGADLIKQVLSFARGVEGQRVRVHAQTLVSDLQNMIRDTFPKNIRFNLETSHDLWTVTGDPTQLHQVLMNLCVNARDAMPHGGTLTLSLFNTVIDPIHARMNPEAKPGPYVVIRVTDSGVGIPPDCRDKIFEPFFTTKEVGKGTGLGLSTSLAIVRSHGGYIRLYSELNRGTTFAIFLPADAPGDRAVTNGLARVKPSQGKGELILLVDDEESIRVVGKAILEGFNYRVMLAENGAEAVAIYRQHGADIAVVVTDMTMPVMDGRTSILELRALNPHVKIITSSGLLPLAGSGASIGEVQHFIAKPYAANTLLEMVRETIDD